ncbi:MAG TPA: methyl-accepting chemotaxis protein, partial [Solirubrobacteraceae bacterium]
MKEAHPASPSRGKGPSGKRGERKGGAGEGTSGLALGRRSTDRVSDEHDQARDAGERELLEDLLHALRAVHAGDFSVRLSARRGGPLGEIVKEFNEVAATNERMANELLRVGRIIGREGRMTERASLAGALGQWQTSVESVNALIDDLVRPTTEVARVLVAVAEGDLSQKMALKIEGQPVKGEFLRIGTTVNTMVDQLSSFADEVTRVARQVGTEGKLGGQAKVKGVSGTWKDLTDSVNLMASNLTSQVRNIAQVTTAVAEGDLSQKITVEAKGEVAALADTINTMVDQLSSFADEVTRVAREVGTEGKLGGQAEVEGVSGTWRGLTESVNFMANNLTDQVRNIAQVTTAVAEGDLSQKITVDVKGEILELKNTINTMVDQLRSFASEVTRVAREVGTEGKLGGQAKVASVSIISLMVSASDAISPLAPMVSAASLRFKSPAATAFVTSAMLRTWLVRLPAMKFTLSVRSFHVPATPGTSAWPPSAPSVPTSRATRVTSAAKERSWSTMVLMVFFSSRISPFTSTVIFFDKSPMATAVVTSAMLRTCPVRLPAI